MWEIFAQIFMFGQCVGISVLNNQYVHWITKVIIYLFCALPEDPQRCFFSLDDKTSHSEKLCELCKVFS